jgi:hypothetical protein
LFSLFFAHSSYSLFSFILDSNGIPGKVVQDASAEALTLLSRHSAEGSNSSSPLDSSGDAAPNLALGQISVLQGRYLITYRMVHSILVMLISEPTANAFVCLRLLDASGKVLVGACKGVDVTPERLSKKYADVHSCLGGLVSGGLSALPPAFTHSSATDGKLLAVPLSPADGARRLRRAQGALGGKAFTPEKSGDGKNDPTPLPMPETPAKKDGKQFSVDGGDPLRGVEFRIPADALPPPPARAMGAKRKPPAPPRATQFVPPVAFQGAVEEEPTGPEEAEGFGAFGAVELMEAEKQEETEKTKSGEWEAEFVPEAEPTGPSTSVKDLQESLQLVEIYRGEVVAGRLHRAIIDGAVRRRLAPFGLETAKFRLLPSSTLVTNACLQVATRNTAHSSEGDENYGFKARLTGAPMDCSYIKYALPSVACLPPLQLDLAVAPPSANANSVPTSLGWEGLIVLRYVSNPDLPGPLLDVVVEIDLAPELGVLVKTSPSAQWSPDECRLKWNLGKIVPGASGIARAVVGAKPGTGSNRAEIALKEETTARVVFTGWPGQSLSGAGFEVAMPTSVDTKEKKEGEKEEKETDTYHKGKAVWFGEMLVKP